MKPLLQAFKPATIFNQWKLDSRWLVSAAIICTLILPLPAQQNAVTPIIETDAVHNSSDAADDICIVLHPQDLSRSVILGTDKSATGGINIYGLSGTEILVYNYGRINNIDIRYNFPFLQEELTIIGASNRTLNSIDIYAIDMEIYPPSLSLIGRKLLPYEPYGLCLFYDKFTTHYSIIVTDQTGLVEQWGFCEVNDNIEFSLMREIPLSSQTEGVVADDLAGFFYLAEEDVGIWKISADTSENQVKTLIDSTFGEGHLTADVEGLTIYHGGETGGYLIASSQGSDEFNVYKNSDGSFLLTFAILPSDSIDGVTQTDGIDVVNLPLGELFPTGLFIAQDDRNLAQNQNFKLCSWGDIVALLPECLSVDTLFDPRVPIPLYHLPMAGSDFVENFSNADASLSFVDDNFAGSNNITWYFLQSRVENGYANNSGIEGNALMLRNVSSSSNVHSSTIPSGITDFYVRLYKGFAEAGYRQVELIVNNVSKGASTIFDDYDEHIFTVFGINVSGDVVIELRNITELPIIVDDISWSNYADQSLPVELSVWKATTSNGLVKLLWMTDSEIENQGFIIERSVDPKGKFWSEIASFATNPDLLGQGSTSSMSDYSYADTQVKVGQTYSYRLSDVDYRGNKTQHHCISVSVIDAVKNLEPSDIKLNKVFPNPFNPSVNLSFTLENEEEELSLVIYDIQGALVNTLSSGYHEMGTHNFNWDGLDGKGNAVVSGVYLVNLCAGPIVEIQRVTLLR